MYSTPRGTTESTDCGYYEQSVSRTDTKVSAEDLVPAQVSSRKHETEKGEIHRCLAVFRTTLEYVLKKLATSATAGFYRHYLHLCRVHSFTEMWPTASYCYYYYYVALVPARATAVLHCLLSCMQACISSSCSPVFLIRVSMKVSVERLLPLLPLYGTHSTRLEAASSGCLAQ